MKKTIPQSASSALYFSYPCDKACFELAVKIDDIKMYYETKNKLWGFSGPVIIYAKWNHSKNS